MPAHTPTESLFIQVAIPSPLRALFDYLPPENEHAKSIQAGTRVMVPFGRRQVTAIVVATSHKSTIDPDKLKPIISILDNTPIIPKGIMQLCIWTSKYYHYSLGETLMLALPKGLRKGKQMPVMTTPCWQLTEPVSPATTTRLQGSKKQLEAVKLLSQNENLSLSEKELTDADINKTILKNLAEKGIAKPYEEKHSIQKFYACPFKGTEQAFVLNNEQQHVLDSLLKNFNRYQPALLDGITGSGKTEVYLQLIAAALEAGKQTLVLIPEIGLTPQTVDRFKRRFRTPIVSLHSGLSDGERLQGWYQAATETTGIVIATRSGIFTPLPRLGLIIVDEEHDASYKQQDTLRYNARDLAIYRARQVSCPVVLGSATPSLESWHNASRDRFMHLTLRKRAGQANPPRMELLDMRNQVLKDGLAPDLITRISSELVNGNQVMVFLNRRGYAPSVICHECGTVIDCPDCDTHMTIHRAPPHMHCHHCDFQTPIPNQCTACKSNNIKPVGQGTERTEQALSQLFPNYPVLRIDRDSTRKKHALNNILEIINSGTPSILLGTQMLAKGHHFPNITLVIILNADAGLFSSDFRGLERTGQLIMQVAGRAGRGNKPGQVVIQSYNPQHRALQTLITNNYTLYLETLLQERRQIGLPPFEHLAMIRAESANSKSCEALLSGIRQYLEQQQITESFQLLGPLPAPMEKRQSRFRWQLFIQSTSRSGIHKSVHALTAYLEQKRLPRHIRWSIDIDPQDMM